MDDSAPNPKDWVLVLKPQAELDAQVDSINDNQADISKLSNREQAMWRALIKTLNDIIAGTQTTPLTLADWKAKIKGEI